MTALQRRGAGPVDWSRYKTRQCLTLHACRVCSLAIRAGMAYRDGGWSKRAHEHCAQAEIAKTQAVAHG